MSDLEGFTDRLHELRSHLQLSGNQFAEVIGQGSTKINGYLRGAYIPKIDFLIVIHKWFPRVNLDYMITGRGKLLLEEGETELNTYEQSPINHMVTESDNDRISQLEGDLKNCKSQLRDKERIIQLLEKSDGK